MKNTIILACVLILGACQTTTTYQGTYKERRAKMCEEKPAFCKPMCSRAQKNEDGSIQLVCN